MIKSHLRRHDLRVRPGEVDSCVERGPVVRLDDVPAVDAVRAHAAVVRTLRPREPVLGPAERVQILGCLLYGSICVNKQE